MTRRMKPYSTKPNPERPPLYMYKLVTLWQKRMRLENWGDIKLYTRNFKDATAAEMRWTRGYKGAAIHFGHKWLCNPTVTYEEAEQVIVHELCHLIFAEMDDKFTYYLGIGEVFLEYAVAREGMCDLWANMLVQRYKRAKRK
jgi:hypothetical protein